MPFSAILDIFIESQPWNPFSQISRIVSPKKNVFHLLSDYCSRDYKVGENLKITINRRKRKEFSGKEGFMADYWKKDAILASFEFHKLVLGC